MLLIADICTFLVVLLLFVVSCPSAVVMALSCFQCNSYLDPACSGTDLDKFKVNCPVGYVGCRKLHFKFVFTRNGPIKERTVRQCAKTKGSDVCHTTFGTNGKRFKENVCECLDNNCNESARLRPLTPCVYIFYIVMFIVVYLSR